MSETDLNVKVENSLSPEQQIWMHHIADRAANSAVHDTFVRLGLDPDRPIEAQKDFAAMRELRLLVADDEWQKDQMHIRRWRKAMDSVQSRGVTALIGMSFLGMIAWAAVYVQRKLGWG